MTDLFCWKDGVRKSAIPSGGSHKVLHPVRLPGLG